MAPRSSSARAGRPRPVAKPVVEAVVAQASEGSEEQRTAAAAGRGGRGGFCFVFYSIFR